MSRRRNNQDGESYKTKRTLKTIAIAVVVTLTATLCASVVGFMSDGFENTEVSTWFEKEVNEANIIKVGAEGYVLAEEDDNGNGVTVKRDENGVIKLNGKSSADQSWIVGTFTLEAGTYTVSGVDSSLKCGLKVTGPNIEVKAGTTNDSFTIEDTTTVTVSIYTAADAFFLNKTIKPVLVVGETAGEFYA
ncbi:MAG: hypothetical protein IJ038_05165 [Clostridia bacterium]|nr:hypothetical protein [Clostridia bacterium]